MTDWRTTLAGILAAILMAFTNASQARQAGGPPLTAGNLAGPAAVAALGILASDKKQPPTTPTSGPQTGTGGQQ